MRFVEGRDTVLQYKVANALPALGALVFGYNAYWQVATGTVPPLQASFSVAVFLTFLPSLISIYWPRSLVSSSDSVLKERRTASKRISAIFALVAIAFLCRSWILLPSDNRWIVLAASTVPATAVVGFSSVYATISSS